LSSIAQQGLPGDPWKKCAATRRGKQNHAQGRGETFMPRKHLAGTTRETRISRLIASVVATLLWRAQSAQEGAAIDFQPHRCPCQEGSRREELIHDIAPPALGESDRVRQGVPPIALTPPARLRIRRASSPPTDGLTAPRFG